MHSIQQFLDTVRIYGKPQTVKNYGFWLLKFHEFVRKPVEEVTAGDVARFIETLRLKYAPLSVSLATAVLKEYLSDYAPQVKARRIKHPKAHAVRPSDPVTPEEYVSMLSFIKADTEAGVLSNTVIRLLYDSGARVSEIKLLLEHPHWLRDGYALIDTAKTSQKRYIAFGSDTGYFLRTWYSFQRRAPSIRRIQRIVRKYASLAKIDKKITPHSFRHAKAKKILLDTGNVKEVQTVLGHRSPLSSFHYFNEYESEKIAKARRWVDG